jgi:hypothetical protein
LHFNETVYDYLNCDYNIIRSSLASTNWDHVFHNLQINDAVHVFYDIIFELYQKKFFNNKYPICFNPILKDLIYKKNIAHILFKKTTSQINYNKFSLLCAQCKSQSKIDYNIYIFNIQNFIKTNPKLFWKFVNHKKMCPTLPNIMMYDNDLFIGG